MKKKKKHMSIKVSITFLSILLVMFFIYYIMRVINSNDYKLKKIGYSSKEINVLNTNNSYIEYALNNNYNDKLVDFIKERSHGPRYSDDFEKMTNSSGSGSSGGSSDGDDAQKDVLYDEILNYAIRMGQISASLIQRKYSIGYNRAARIMDMFEERGIVGPAKGSKPRDVLVKYEDNGGEN